MMAVLLSPHCSCTACYSTASFMLALEGLWLFAQPPEAYLQQHSGTAPSAATPAVVDAGQLQLVRLWPTFLLRLLALLEATVTPAAATKLAAKAATGTTPQPEGEAAAGAADSAESIQAGVIAPAAPLLFGMLGEALQHLALHWQQQPAAARAALIRVTIAESEQALVVRQRRSTALLGKAKPKPGEVVAGQLLLMTKQLALLLTELLQLERSTCGGPQRDGVVPVTESGACTERSIMPFQACASTQYTPVSSAWHALSSSCVKNSSLPVAAFCCCFPRH
jgi:hypothetical protein